MVERREELQQDFPFEGSLLYNYTFEHGLSGAC